MTVVTIWSDFGAPQIKSVTVSTVVKQEMIRVSINILGISKLKCTGMGEFNLDDHYIFYCGRESLKKNGVAIILNKRV